MLEQQTSVNNFSSENIGQKKSKQSVALKIRNHFLKTGWPPTVIVSGESSLAKENFILNSIALSLFQHQNSTQGAWSTFNTVEKVREAMKQNLYPDFIYFADNKIAIGESNSPEEGTIRHLFRHVLSRFPLWGNKRFIYFKDGSLIQNEAESALLKNLEEPRPENHFILSVDDSEKLKDTIRSRSIEIPFRQQINLKETPATDWEKFWFFSGWQGSNYYELLESHNFLDIIQKFYQSLTRREEDFDLFDRFFSENFQKIFDAQKAETKTILLHISFLPFYFSCRDLLVKGVMPTIGAFSFPKGEIHNLIAILKITEEFFADLGHRSYGTISGNIFLIYFRFLDKLMPHWIIR